MYLRRLKFHSFNKKSERRFVQGSEKTANLQNLPDKNFSEINLDAFAFDFAVLIFFDTVFGRNENSVRERLDCPDGFDVVGDQ
jgi:hypothetical protein